MAIDIFAGKKKKQVNTEMNYEMFQQLFNNEIFIAEEEDDELDSFCLAEKPADKIRVLVLLNDELNKTASASDIELLVKIADFKDYHLTREEVAVMNLAHQTVSLNSLKKNFSSANILCFGISPAEIGLQIDPRMNQLINFSGVNFVFTSALQEISKNEKLKKQFFIEALKPMFSLPNQGKV